MCVIVISVLKGNIPYGDCFAVSPIPLRESTMLSIPLGLWEKQAIAVGNAERKQKTPRL